MRSSPFFQLLCNQFATSSLFNQLCAGLLATVAYSFAFAEEIHPFPRQVLSAKAVLSWTFDADAERWVAMHDTQIDAGGGTLNVRSLGEDPYVHSPRLTEDVAGPVRIRMRIKCDTSGTGQLFWTTRKSPGWSEERSARFALTHDQQWHEYDVPLKTTDALTQLRLDPGSGTGDVAIDWIGLSPYRMHPLEIEFVTSNDTEIRLRIRNHAPQAIVATVNNQSVNLPGETVQEIAVPAVGSVPFQSVPLEVHADGLPTLRRTVFLYRPEADVGWIVRRSGAVSLQVAPDGSGAKVLRDGRLVAVIGPFVQREGVVLPLQRKADDEALVFEGDQVAVVVRFDHDELRVTIDSSQDCEGPVVRVPGQLEQGLFSGLEYLGQEEQSSSTRDIETAEHLRFAPDPLQVTMPLMAIRTPSATVSMLWEDMQLQPVFAAPNFLDGAPGHRMSLRGRRFAATIRVGTDSLEDAILWAVRKRGLPPLPPPPRDRIEQWKLCQKAIDGPLKNDQGWGHCAEPKWKRQPYADIASTVFRLTGRVPELPRLVPGGAHVRNEAAFFLTGRVDQWRQQQRHSVENLKKSQKPDGSFRYQGKYRRGHFEDTSSGLCAQRALVLLEYAWITGDKPARDAGLRALEFMKRFRTPRGAQIWELSLHTPDILASADLVRAYLRGYELTGQPEYLERARRWALTGVPFVYQWSQLPVMMYATVPVYGATNWRAPNWIGRPVQWCGLVYAYALVKLAEYDQTLDWRHMARGILYAGEQMQYPDGDLAGCLPDVFELEAQRRAGPSINPCALVSLRLALDGQLDNLAVATDGVHRVAAPFPVVLKDGRVHIHARSGLDYQILIDGSRVETIRSRGIDAISLDGT